MSKGFEDIFEVHVTKKNGRGVITEEFTSTNFVLTVNISGSGEDLNIRRISQATSIPAKDVMSMCDAAHDLILQTAAAAIGEMMKDNVKNISKENFNGN